MTGEKQEKLRSGKERVAQATAWQLDLGGLHIRCVRRSSVLYEVQIRMDSGWELVGNAPDAETALRLAIAAPSVRTAIMAHGKMARPLRRRTSPDQRIPPPTAEPTQTAPPRVPDRVVRLISLEADCDPRSVRKRLKGVPVRGSGDRIDRCLAAHGISRRVSSQ